MDILVISLKKGPTPKLDALKRMFPEADVHVQTGVDIRKARLKDVHDAKLVGPSGYFTIKHGRKWSWELNSLGGVGLVHANRLALSKGTRPLLLLEDDYHIARPDAFKQALTQLLDHADAFDAASFGASKFSGNPSPVDYLPKGWYHVDADTRFYNLHCVFYSSSGRRTLAHWLSEGNPLEMQLDGLYSHWAETRGLRMLVELDHHTVVQSKHFSTIQTDMCPLCAIRPFKATSNDLNYLVVVGVIVASVVLCAGVGRMARRRSTLFRRRPR